MPLSKGVRAVAHVDGDIEDDTAYYSYKLSLWLLLLIVQAAQHPPGRSGVIILPENGGQPMLDELPFVECFEKESTLVGKDLRLDEEHAGQIRFFDLHSVDASRAICSRYRP